MQIEQEGIENVIFMQEGAPPQIYQITKEMLTAVFQDRFISRYFVSPYRPILTQRITACEELGCKLVQFNKKCKIALYTILRNGSSNHIEHLR